MGSEQISRFTIREITFHEREVKLRMPFRFGIVTLTESPQAFVRAKIFFQGREVEGAAAELLAPKWFDKNPALSNEDNYEQLRASLRRAREAYLAGGPNTAYGHSRPSVGLVENYGPALIDRAVLDALCRALGISFYRAIKANVPGVDFAGLDLAGLTTRATLGMTVDELSDKTVKSRDLARGELWLLVDYVQAPAPTRTPSP